MNIHVISSTEEVYMGSEVISLQLVTTSGVIEVLPGHINLVTVLETGKVIITQIDKTTEIFINGGLLQVAGNDLILLADEATLPENLILEQIEKAIKLAEQKISSDLDPAELIQLEKILRYEKFKRDQLRA